jgi:hypothetical protein
LEEIYLSEGTAIDAEDLAADPLGGVGGEEADHAADVGWQADAIQGG